jgi:hypothetical protein
LPGAGGVRGGVVPAGTATAELARAKALPAYLFCTRVAFERSGGFNERVALGEEWPITAGQWRCARRRFLYDTQAEPARTSGRRMERQPLGYTRAYLKWAAAVILPTARRSQPDIREPAKTTEN